jgi:universal stress protein A
MTLRLKKILIPTDFSDYSAAAGSYACELAARFDAELHLLHTLEHQYSLTPEFGLGLALPTQISESKLAAENALSGLLDSGWLANRKVVHRVLEGSPKAEIVRYALAENIDMIVISTHGRTGLAQMLIGSVAETVVRTSPCPVLTVRPKGHQFVMP